MISFDFDYYRPASINEAVAIYHELTADGKNPIYYGGGTEIISLAQLNQIQFEGVIDLKEIPECNVYAFQGEKLVIGSTVNLTTITDVPLFPLLSASCRRAADHTLRSKITIGGHICGKTPYREALLPFLLANSEIVIAGKNGLTTKPLMEIFDQTLQLKQGEFVAQITAQKSYTTLPYSHIKKTKQDRLDYPLLTVAATLKDQRVSIAFSGLCAFPFRSLPIEDDLNNKAIPLGERINTIFEHLPAPILNDILGSAAYRDFVLRTTLTRTIKQLGVAN